MNGTQKEIMDYCRINSLQEARNKCYGSVALCILIQLQLMREFDIIFKVKNSDAHIVPGIRFCEVLMIYKRCIPNYQKNGVLPKMEIKHHMMLLQVLLVKNTGGNAQNAEMSGRPQ